MFKYELDQLIYYLMDNKICSAPVLSRASIQNKHDDWNSTDEQKSTFTPFGKSGIFYGTCHGIVNEEDAFPNKDELKEIL